MGLVGPPTRTTYAAACSVSTISTRGVCSRRDTPAHVSGPAGTMTPMTAYWISSYLEITDKAKLEAYAELAGPPWSRPAARSWPGRCPPRSSRPAASCGRCSSSSRRSTPPSPPTRARPTRRRSPPSATAPCVTCGSYPGSSRRRPSTAVSTLATRRDGAVVGPGSCAAPSAATRLDLELCRAINTTADAEVEAGARVLVVTGAGTSFCSGADLTGVYGEEFLQALYGMLHGPAGLDLPAGAGGGQCRQRPRDRRRHPASPWRATSGSAADSADSPSRPHATRWRSTPGPSGNLADVAGGGVARRLMVAAETIDRAAAVACGLVDRAGTLDDALAWAHEIAALAPLSLAHNKRVLNGRRRRSRSLPPSRRAGPATTSARPPPRAPRGARRSSPAADVRLRSLAAVAVLVLAGCSDAPPETTPGPSPSRTAPPSSSTPPPSPQPEPAPAPPRRGAASTCPPTRARSPPGPGLPTTSRSSTSRPPRAALHRPPLRHQLGEAAARAGLRVGGYHYFTLCSDPVPGRPLRRHARRGPRRIPRCARGRPELLGNCDLLPRPGRDAGRRRGVRRGGGAAHGAARRRLHPPRLRPALRLRARPRPASLGAPFPGDVAPPG